MRRSDGVRVAVKTVPKRRAVYVEMLRNEIAILRGLDHANIIKLYDEFEDEKQVGCGGRGEEGGAEGGALLPRAPAELLCSKTARDRLWLPLLCGATSVHLQPRRRLHILPSPPFLPTPPSHHRSLSLSLQVHLVFELCTGGELFEPIADQGFRFSERQASRIVRKLLDTVKHIHDKEIVHRDLKPENMLLSGPGVDAELKVIDFGLACK